LAEKLDWKGLKNVDCYKYNTCKMKGVKYLTKHWLVIKSSEFLSTHRVGFVIQ
jgi:hypothetical protein